LVKGINKKIVEVRALDSDRFERAIFFVRDSYAEESGRSLSSAANQCLNDEFRIPAARKLRCKPITAVYCLLSAAVGSLITLLVK